MKATAVAPSNIALVKYWGKRNEERVIPQNPNLSMTFDELVTTTTIEFAEEHDDTVVMNGEVAEGQKHDRTARHLSYIRDLAGIDTPFHMETYNNFPTKAGVASSASGGAAEAYAAAEALGLDYDERRLTQLARLSGSGSASRSVHGGFVVCHPGEEGDGSDCYSEQLVDEDYWPEFRVLVAITREGEKRTVSSAGMRESRETSPFYDEWIRSGLADFQTVRQAVLDRDFTTVGETAEHNCLKMHGTMLATRPSLIYWEPETVDVMKAVQSTRQDGPESYFTIDAGPQVKVMCLEDDEDHVAGMLGEMDAVKKIIPSRPGPGARLVDEHLF